MKYLTTLLLTLLVLGGCGPSQAEKEAIAAVTCSIMSETRNMDAAIRVREMNEARVKIGGEPFLKGDDAIKESFEWALCQELVLNENYDVTLQYLKDAKREKERRAAEKRAAEERRAAEKRAVEERLAAEKRRITDSKPSVEEEFHSNGKLKSRKNYQSKDDGGKLHGLEEIFYENGQLRYEINYKDGELDGDYRAYNEDGSLWYGQTYKDGKIISGSSQ